MASGNVQVNSNASLQNPYKQFTYTLAANAQVEVFYAFNYFRVISFTGTANDLRLRFGGSGSDTEFPGAGIGYELSEAVDRIFIRNTGGGSIDITIALAIGRISDDRLNVSGTVNVTGTVEISNDVGNPIPVNGSLTSVGSITNVVSTSEEIPTTLDSIADVSVANNTTTLLAAADATRKELHVCNPEAAGGSNIRIGDSGAGSANGIILQPGAIYIITTEAAVYAWHNKGSSISVPVMRIQA